MPTRQDNHSAHDLAPASAQPALTSNSPTSSSRRAVATSMWAESSAISSPSRFSSSISGRGVVGTSMRVLLVRENFTARIRRLQRGSPSRDVGAGHAPMRAVAKNLAAGGACGVLRALLTGATAVRRRQLPDLSTPNLGYTAQALPCRNLG